MITNSDISKAIKISQALQEYFDKNKGCGRIRSTDAYEILVKQNLVEKDRHSGIKFREFLHHLMKNNHLHLIPQCKPEQASPSMTNWFFQSAKNKTVTAKNLIPVSEIGKQADVNEEDIKQKVAAFPKRKDEDFTHVHHEIRASYPRAYEYWTKEEDELMLSLVKEIIDSDKLASLLQRQPSAVRRRLKEKFGIEI
jgi:hypothetical protein